MEFEHFVKQWNVDKCIKNFSDHAPFALRIMTNMQHPGHKNPRLSWKCASSMTVNDKSSGYVGIASQQRRTRATGKSWKTHVRKILRVNNEMFIKYGRHAMH